MNNFPFDIMDIANILNLKVRHRKPTSIDVDCPFCSKQAKMNINTAKNVFRCNYCGESGGTLQLYANVYGITTKEAYHEILDCMNSGNAKKWYSTNKVNKNINEEIPQSSLVPINARNHTYCSLLSLLSLSPTHEKSLLERGLTMEQIKKHGYKSIPAYGYSNLVKELIHRKCVVEGVPGFYKKRDGDWTINFNCKASGIIIPIKDKDGSIQTAQIRLDNPVNGRKYIWLSSSSKNLGASAGAPVHFVGDPKAKTIHLTEGALKGTIAHELSGNTYLCIAGINQLKSLMSTFPKFNDVSHFVSCFDMDMYSNKHVMAGVLKILNAIRSKGCNISYAKWDSVNKGIDDYYWAKELKKRVISQLQDIPTDLKEQELYFHQWIIKSIESEPISSSILQFLYFNIPYYELFSYLYYKSKKLRCPMNFDELIKLIENEINV